MRIFFIFFSFIFIISGCKKENGKLMNSNDYNSYLNLKGNKTVDFALSEIKFWQNKYDKSPTQTSYLNKIAAYYSLLFEQTGNIEDLHKAENLLIESNKKLNYKDVGSLRSLARNYITQHRFKEALTLAEKAYQIGEKLHETHKLLFDVQMELGNYEKAKESLKAIYDINDFDYLIRLAKWNDHKGDLNTAISIMENASRMTEKLDNKSLMTWSYSNLGDMYGHAGKINDSYDYYLKTLNLDSNNSFALKGLAWIAFSHEKNTKEAKRILEIVSKKHNSPDFYLLKAEVAEYEKDFASQKKYLHDYFMMLDSNNYGVMYNKYNALLFSEENKKLDEAFKIANQEISNRPTPQSYDLLAWAYFKNGESEKALKIVNEHVVKKSFEPEVMFHLASIYKANNLLNEVKPIKKELESSIFELGPNMSAKIQSL
ncbi:MULTISPECIES: tetratricopeptide repeat protein [Flavobacterium]|nr:tetratricopeptide repeat protein [Flavobacterium sp. N1846]